MLKSMQDERKTFPRTKVVILLILINFWLLVYLYTGMIEQLQKGQPATTEIRRTNKIIFHKSSNSNIIEDSMSHSKTRRLPQALIIGSRKSGTRALLRFLEVNPAVRAAHTEVHFFDRPQNYKLGYDWYKNQMPESSEFELTIEKSPSYFVTQSVPDLVKAMNSTIKLVIILRDPVTRLISDYSQLVANKIESFSEREEDAYDYKVTIGDYPEYSISNSNNLSKSVNLWKDAAKNFEKYVLRSDGGIDDQARAVKIGMYSLYIERWRALFPFNQFHFVDGEALIKNPYSELKKLELFLGLKPAIRPDNFVFNSRKGFYCLAINSSNPEQHESRNTSQSKPMQGRSKILALSCLSRSKGRRHVNVRKDLILELRKFYAPYNEYLYSLIGKKFDWPRGAQ